MNIILIFEWIALAFSLATLSKKNDKRLPLLILIMIVTVVVEAIGYYYHRVLDRANHSFYNVSVPLIILLFLLLFSKYYERRSSRLFARISIPFFVAFCLIDLFLIQGTQRFCTYNYIVGALLLVACSILYYLELIRYSQVISLKSEPMFWIATAILLLYLPKSILYAVFEYLAYRNEVMQSFGTTFHLINKTLSVIFFCFFSYACICRPLTSRN